MPTKTEPRDAARRRQAFLLDFLAIFFVLLAPYLNFVLGKGFVYEATNLAIAGAFAGTAGALATLLWFVRSELLRVGILAFLLLLFVDIQLYWYDSWLLKIGIGAVVLGRLGWHGRRHLSLLVTAFMGTVVASTVALALWDGSISGTPSARAGSAEGKSGQPVYVHIILDEFMGPEGFDTDIPNQTAIKNEIKAFFTDRGFRLFGRAYSPYYDSYDSISAALNMVETRETGPLYRAQGDGLVISQNRTFELLRSRGYEINVYQSSYMDFCTASTVDIRKCLTYDFAGLTSRSLAGLGTAEKMRLVMTMYAYLATLGDMAFAAYGTLGASLTALGLTLPVWPERSDRLGPIPVMPAIEELVRDVGAAQGGSMFFAHLFIPHYPYSLGADCRIRLPVMSWDNRSLLDTDIGEINTAESRQARYEGYIAQVRCSLQKVVEVLDTLKTRGLYEDATIIIQGDHGSRIVRVEPRTANLALLSPRDYTDGFLTLYAVKSPEISPGYDARPVSLPQLARALMDGDIDAPADRGGNRPPTVYLRAVPSMRLSETPVPCVAGTRQSGDNTGLAPRCADVAD